ncbi:MAG: acetyl-CoA hydrolase/transferase C-terminal domain-containing protein [Candidatus Sericytochromatia bacterium]|nr:acetyl-CoA hydrolase/transferase C-terminal domain-containing protein [Candidatus Sericytochromatia bacterium]
MSEFWRSRALEAAEVVSLVRDGDRVFLHGGCAVALPLEAALAQRARQLADIVVYQMHKEGEEALLDPALAGRVRVVSMFCGAQARAAVNAGLADFMPVFLSEIPHLMRHRAIPIDVAVVQLSMPDAHGWCSLGTSVDVAHQAVASARVVLAELNAQVPRTHGDSLIHVDDLDAFIVTDRPLLEVAPRPLDDVSLAIGRHIADLVDDGATLQVGIGAIPDAALAAMGNKQDLGVHTEMFSDGLVTLLQRGVITNARKALAPGRTVTSFVIGTRKTYDFVHDNPAVVFHPSDVVNDTALIRQHARMTAINCAIEVDLTGQVCADSIGESIYSGIGGQMDFIRGAAIAPAGKAIIALPATAKGGNVSRITPTLAAGAGVVTTRGHVQYVVTEHGVAQLMGKTLRERAEALLAIAHPDHRPALRAAIVARRQFGPPAVPPQAAEA